jgi:hypothetical protein
MQKTILILGDSTSASLGMNQHTHHMILANKNIWPLNTIILNCSMPGMTSADCNAFYKKLSIEKKKSIQAIFIYLGNCDTIAVEYPKKRYTTYKHFKYNLFNKLNKIDKKKLKNSLLLFEWNKNIDLTREIPETSEDFEYNIRNIISKANYYNSKVILVNTKANKNFLPGLAKGNFLFYKYFGIKDKLASKIIIDDPRFISALQYHENEEYHKALKQYKIILEDPIEVKMGQSYPLMVLNNYAVCLADLGKFEEAKELLNLYLTEKFSRKEIGYYNQAMIEKEENNIKKSLENLEYSYESDTYMYRIRKPYQDVLSKIINEEKVLSIDLEKYIKDFHFQDHCHLLPSGQILLSKVIQNTYAKIGIKGNEKAKIVNDLYNPDLGNGNISRFEKYFKVNSSINVQRLNKQFQRYFNNFQGQSLEEYELNQLNISNSIQDAYFYFLKHPLFNNKEDFNEINFIKSDIGRFPENFHYRFLASYIKEIEISHTNLIQSYNEGQFLIHCAADFKKIHLEQTGLNDLTCVVIENFSKSRLEIILESINQKLIAHLACGNTFYNRIKTTIFWYFRESLRFGFHSRHSMNYDRVLLENIAESLLIVEYFNKKNNYAIDSKISFLKDNLFQVIKIHEKYSKSINLIDKNNSLLIQYDNDLSKIYNQLSKLCTY